MHIDRQTEGPLCSSFTQPAALHTCLPAVHVQPSGKRREAVEGPWARGGSGGSGGELRPASKGEVVCPEVTERA